MPSSRPTLSPSRRAISTHSAMVTPRTGTKGTTSAAPMRGCWPRCSSMSMSCAALAMPRKAASSTASGSPTMVTTERLWSASECTSSTLTPGTAAMAPTI